MPKSRISEKFEKRKLAIGACYSSCLNLVTCGAIAEIFILLTLFRQWFNYFAISSRLLQAAWILPLAIVAVGILALISLVLFHKYEARTKLLEDQKWDDELGKIIPSVESIDEINSALKEEASIPSTLNNLKNFVSTKKSGRSSDYCYHNGIFRILTEQNLTQTEKEQSIKTFTNFLREVQPFLPETTSTKPRSTRTEEIELACLPKKQDL